MTVLHRAPESSLAAWQLCVCLAKHLLPQEQAAEAMQDSGAPSHSSAMLSACSHGVGLEPPCCGAQVPVAHREKLLIKGGVNPADLANLRLVYEDPQVPLVGCYTAALQLRKPCSPVACCEAIPKQTLHHQRPAQRLV